MNTTTLAEYLVRKHKELLDNIASYERTLVQEVLTKTMSQVIYLKGWIEHQQNSIRLLEKDVERYLDTQEFYDFIKDNLDHFKREYYWVKEVVVKKHLSRIGDFKALHYNFAP